MSVVPNYGQQVLIDSLEKYYPYTTDEKRLDICVQLSSMYRNIDPGKGIEYAREGVSLSLLLENKESEAVLLNEIGVLFRKMGEFDKALDYHQKALILFTELEDKMGEAYCYANIASVNGDMGYYELALEYALRSLELKVELGDEGQIAYTYRIIASIYHESGRYDEALPYYEKSLEYYQNVGNLTEQANVFLNKAILITSLQNEFKNEDVRNIFIKAQQIYEKSGSNYGVASVYFHRGEWEGRIGNNAVAEQCLLRSLEICEKINARSLKYDVVLELSKFYESLGYINKAYKYLLVSSDLQAILFSEKSAKKISDIESQILVKDQENQISNLKHLHMRERILLIISVFLLLVALFIFAAFLKRYFQSKKLNLMLKTEVSHRRKSEQMLIASENMLKASIEDKNRFLSIISHDIRSPFSGVYGMISLLHDQYDNFTEEERKNIIYQLSNSSNQINLLLDDLISWSSVNSGKIPYRPQVVDFSKLSCELIKMLGIRANEKNIEIQCPQRPVYVYADAHMLKTILMNLLTNAIKFSFPNGKVLLDAIKDEKTGSVDVSIIDYGVGMDQITLEQISKPDIQMSKLGTEGEKGSGVGLLLVHELLIKHNSKLKICSYPGKGTEMHFVLPEGKK